MTDKIETFPDFLRALADGPVYFGKPTGATKGVRLDGERLVACHGDKMTSTEIELEWMNRVCVGGFTRTPPPAPMVTHEFKRDGEVVHVVCTRGGEYVGCVERARPDNRWTWSVAGRWACCGSHEEGVRAIEEATNGS
jgi:hypothetical protein